MRCVAGGSTSRCAHPDTSSRPNGCGAPQSQVADKGSVHEGGVKKARECVLKVKAVGKKVKAKKGDRALLKKKAKKKFHACAAAKAR